MSGPEGECDVMLDFVGGGIQQYDASIPRTLDWVQAIQSIVVMKEFRKSSGWGMLEPFTVELWLAILGMWLLICITIGLIHVVRSAEQGNVLRQAVQASPTSSMHSPVLSLCWNALCRPHSGPCTTARQRCLTGMQTSGLGGMHRYFGSS